MDNSDDSGPYREAVTTRITPQNYERYEEYIDRESISKSEGLRRLIRAGLDEKEGEKSGEVSDGIDRRAVTLATYVAAVMFIIVEYAGTTEGLGSSVGGGFILVMLLWAQYPTVKHELSRLRKTTARQQD